MKEEALHIFPRSKSMNLRGELLTKNKSWVAVSRGSFLAGLVEDNHVES